MALFPEVLKSAKIPNIKADYQVSPVGKDRKINPLRENTPQQIELRHCLHLELTRHAFEFLIEIPGFFADENGTYHIRRERVRARQQRPHLRSRFHERD